MPQEPKLVLLVEDNEDHAELVKRTLKDAACVINIDHVRDGEAALGYLGLSGPQTPSEADRRPALILLDLRLPKIDGLDVLRKIKDATLLRRIPVVVLTTSTSPKDVRGAYALHANGYVAKPASFDSFSRMMKDLGRYWPTWNTTSGLRAQTPGPIEA